MLGYSTLLLHQGGIVRSLFLNPVMLACKVERQPRIVPDWRIVSPNYEEFVILLEFHTRHSPVGQTVLEALVTYLKS